MNLTCESTIQDKKEFAIGEPTQLAEGVYIIRQPLPFSPKHINCYLIEDVAGVTLVDTGMNSKENQDIWDNVLCGDLCRNGVKQIYMTHGHPDHIGLGKWLMEKTGAPMLITEAERDIVNNSWRGASDHKEEVLQFFMQWGLPEDLINGIYGMQDGFRNMCPELDFEVTFLQDKQKLSIGHREFQVLYGYGHTPCHATLYCAEDGLVFTGDQVLPRIFPNISVWWGTPANPLGNYLESTQWLKQYDYSLAMPSHDWTFTNVHGRIDEICTFHQQRMQATLEHCQETPRTAFECIEVVLGKKTPYFQLGLTLGQAMAVMEALEAEGKLLRSGEEVFYFQATAAANPSQAVNQ